MASQWETLMDNLVEYLADRTDIRIGTVVSIPPKYRQEFYTKFDQIRGALIDEIFPPDAMDKAQTLIQNYSCLEKEIIRKFHLIRISLEPKLEKFLQGPKSQFMEELYFPLFDVLKGKTSIETFLDKSKTLPALFDVLYQKLYSKWISLALINLCKAQEISAFYLGFRTKDHSIGDLVLKQPECIKSDFIDFCSTRPFVLPDFATYCPDYKCYIAVKAEMNIGNTEFAYGVTSTERRKWTISKPGVTIFSPENVFVYVSSSIQEISLLVNKAVCCPDAVIRHFPQDDWYTQERWQETIKLQEEMSPKITCVIGRAPVDKAYQSDDRIKIIDVGFEYHKLDSILYELLAPYKTNGLAEEKRGKRLSLGKWIRSLFAPKTLVNRFS